MNGPYSQEIDFDNPFSYTNRQALEVENHSFIRKPQPDTRTLGERLQASLDENPRLFSLSVLVVIVLSLVLITINLSSKVVNYIDFGRNSFFTLQEQNSTQIWSLYVDKPNSRVFYIEGFVENVGRSTNDPLALNKRLLEEEQLASPTTVFVHSFNSNQLKAYQLVKDSSMNHEYCFGVQLEGPFNIIPSFLSSAQYQKSRKDSLESASSSRYKYTLSTPESEQLAEIFTNSAEDLTKIHIKDHDNSVTYQVAKPFPVESLKTRIDNIKKCYAYDLEQQKPEASYESSPMKCPIQKYTSSQNFASKQESQKTKLTPVGMIKDALVGQTYGNWCGPHYGGFDNQCASFCNQDHWKISDDCQTCWPPVDYTDSQCMWHDLCKNRHDVLKTGSDGCKALNNTLLENVPCECDFEIMKGLEEDKLVEGCKLNEDCLSSGRMIRKTLNLHPCGCRAKKCWNIPKLEGNLKIGVKIGWKEVCIDNETCIPSYICSSLSDSA